MGLSHGFPGRKPQLKLEVNQLGLFEGTLFGVQRKPKETHFGGQNEDAPKSDVKGKPPNWSTSGTSQLGLQVGRGTPKFVRKANRPGQILRSSH